MQIIPRATWDARAPRSRNNMRANAGVVLHHSAGPSSGQSVRAIQDFHMNTRRWADIAYNYLVNQNGEIFEGRGQGIQGAHCPGANSTHHGVCVIGTNELSDKAAEAVRWLWGHLGGGELKAHSDFYATACPGDVIRAFAKGQPRPQVQPRPQTTGWPGEYLKYGSRGTNTKTYQARMISRGWVALVRYGGADGIFGRATDEVTRQFQAEKHLAVDGVVGPITWETAFRFDNIT